MGDDSIDTVISHIDMGYLVTLDRPWLEMVARSSNHGPPTRLETGMAFNAFPPTAQLETGDRVKASCLRRYAEASLPLSLRHGARVKS
jgi:hypothetical protein